MEEEKILAIIGDEAVYGIDGGIDTGVDNPEDTVNVMLQNPRRLLETTPTLTKY